MTMATQAAQEEVASGQEIYWLREVVLGSKTHICSLSLLPLSGEVWL